MKNASRQVGQCAAYEQWRMDQEAEEIDRTYFVVRTIPNNTFNIRVEIRWHYIHRMMEARPRSWCFVISAIFRLIPSEWKWNWAPHGIHLADGNGRNRILSSCILLCLATNGDANTTKRRYMTTNGDDNDISICMHCNCLPHPSVRRRAHNFDNCATCHFIIMQMGDLVIFADAARIVENMAKYTIILQRATTPLRCKWRDERARPHELHEMKLK